MNKHDLIRIETELAVRLPKVYRQFMLAYPEQLLNTDAPDFGLLLEPERVVEENLRVRKGPLFGLTWPVDLFLIGEDGCGDLFAVALSDPKGTVQRLDHEVPAFVFHSNSLDEYAGMLIEDFNGCQVGEDSIPLPVVHPGEAPVSPQGLPPSGSIKCQCATFGPIELSRKAIAERAGKTKSICAALSLLVKHSGGKHALYECTHCGKTWQYAQAWNVGHKFYVFHVPSIDVGAWQTLPYQDPHELLCYADTITMFLDRCSTKRSSEPCRVARCDALALQGMGKCVTHQIEMLQAAGMMTKHPVGRPFPPYEVPPYNGNI